MQVIGPKPSNVVPSLLDAMQDGNEYGSIVSLAPADGNIVPELRRALAEIEGARGRPCICYAANLVRSGAADTAIAASDHLPFSEMVGRIDPAIKQVDILLATPGGSAEQVNLFVEALRPRFDSVEFLIPYKAMSAGTLWALSGDRIWMDHRAFLGPLDPQVPSKDGALVPAQALLTLLDKIQKEGDAALARKQNPPWALIRLLDQMDQKQLGAAISASNYVLTMAAQYLERHKFRTWQTHRSTGQPVTDQDRQRRALEVAGVLCSHDRWKAHGHAISRDVLWNEVRIQIDHPDAALQRAMRRLWALLYYTFDKSPVVKLMVSSAYAFFRMQHMIAVEARP
ncbi:MAG: hypothetical protein HYZ28_13545 [Myxococcales bacterium]|nr:hypothetical protein [Myxococcales bacterium]